MSTGLQKFLVLQGVILGIGAAMLFSVPYVDAQSAQPGNRTTSITASGTLTANKHSATAASGANGFENTVNGARIDFGAGASDYASSNGTTVTFAGPIASTTLATSGTIASSVASGSSAITTLDGARITMGSSGCFIKGDQFAQADITGCGTIFLNAVNHIKRTLATCSASTEGMQQWDILSGVSTGTPTRVCECRGDGSGGNYKWYNRFSATPLTGGTTTTCPA